MNVSIAKVVEDLDTTVSGVQGAIALEALVSAAFILIGSKVGDLIGRKRAFVLGLLGYALGALAMALSQGLTAIIVFWAIIGGLGASLLLPAMQSLIHGNFHGAAQKKAYALVGAAAAIAAAVGPLIGGVLTTFLSWRVGFLLEVVVIARRAHQPQADSRRALHRPARRRRRRRGAVGRRHGRRRDRHPRLAGGRGVRRPPDRGRSGRARVTRALARPAQARGQADAARSRSLQARPVPAGHLVADAAEHRTRRGDDRPADLPADGAGVQRPGDRPDARAAVPHDVRDGTRGRQAGGRIDVPRASSAPAPDC